MKHEVCHIYCFSKGGASRALGRVYRRRAVGATSRVERRAAETLMPARGIR